MDAYQRWCGAVSLYRVAMRLEKWQRNAIFNAVVAGDLDPRECSFDYDDAWVRITHRPSGSYFLLEGDALRYNGNPSSGIERRGQ